MKGKNGGLAVLAKYGKAYFAELGRKGGIATAKKYQLVPVRQNTFAMVERETGKVKCIIGADQWTNI